MDDGLPRPSADGVFWIATALEGHRPTAMATLVTMPKPAICLHESEILPMDPEFLEQIERARRMTGEEKVRESLQLFDRTRRLVLDGLRGENPGASEKRIERLFVERLELNRSLESAG